MSAVQDYGNRLQKIRSQITNTENSQAEQENWQNQQLTKQQEAQSAPGLTRQGLVSKTNATHSATSVLSSPISDAENSIDTEEIDNDRQNLGLETQNYNTVNDHIACFCHPESTTAINGMKRSQIAQHAESIMKRLNALEHPDKERLVETAARLLQEELQAQSIILHYRNAMVFS